MAKPASTEQKKWMSDIAEWAKDNLHVLYGEAYRGYNSIQLHHVTGRASKQNKVAIGHWYILAIPKELHDVMSNHSLNVTHRKKAFTAKYGMQKDLFGKMVNSMGLQGYAIPSDDVFWAILSTNE